jgi:hypothetical protein
MTILKNYCKKEKLEVIIQNTTKMIFKELISNREEEGKEVAIIS